MTCYTNDNKKIYFCTLGDDIFDYHYINSPLVNSESTEEIPFFYQGLLTVIILGYSVFLSSLLVANFVWKPMRKLDREDLIEPEKPYCQRYYPVPDKTRDNVDSLKNSYLNEWIDKFGMVIMCYDKEEEAFHYWCDKEVNYEYINTVVRKYVTIFQCKNIYIDRSEEMNKYNDEIKRRKEEKEMKENDKESNKEKEEEKEEEDDSPFVKFKSRTNKEKEKIEEKEEDEKWWLNEKSKIIIQKMNKIKYKGKISNLAIINKPKVKEESKPLTFADFRNLISSK